MTEREKFEQWIDTLWMPCFMDRDASGEYKDHDVYNMWEAWKAATDASTHKAIYEDEV